MKSAIQMVRADKPVITDFNDQARHEGAERVRERIQGALAQADASATAPPSPLPNEAKGDAQNATPEGESAAEKNPRGRPKKPAGAEPVYVLDSKGVWFFETGEDGEAGLKRWICAPLKVIAKTRSSKGKSWGYLLHWKDPDGQKHTWAAPSQLLVGDGNDFVKELVSNGLEVAPGATAIKRLLAYVKTADVEDRARALAAPGWFGRQYVLPTGEVFGKGQEPIVYQHTGNVIADYETAGSWKEKIAPLCVGNSRLVLAVSVMYSSPLMRLVGIGGGGFHFIGSSSTGKTTALQVAASVVGSEKYIRKWRATSTALEGLAVAHNDATLILDEIAEMDANQVGETVYMLANGSGKARANRVGDPRQVADWMLQTLSTGEVTLAQHMEQAGKKIKAGQAVRLADIPADAGAGLGIFENIHGSMLGKTFAEHLAMRCRENFGETWRPWLEYISGKNTETITLHLRQEIEAFHTDAVPEKADGQVSRVAARFALAGAAGELATVAGLTGWKSGEARRAALRCFADWLAMRGGAEKGEHIALFSQIRAFFEAHGQSRFESLQDEISRPIFNRAGFTRYDALNGLQYLVMRETFERELCKGFNPRQAAKWLVSAKWLAVSDARHNTQNARIKQLGDKPIRVFIFNASTVHGADASGEPQAPEVCPF